MLVLLALVLGASVIFATTVVDVPAPSPLPLGFERMAPLPFPAQVNRIRSRIRHILGAPGPQAPQRQLTIAFYTSWADESGPSLSKHIDQVDWVAPTLMAIVKGHLTVEDDPRLRQALVAHAHRPLVVPVLQNAVEEKWDGAGAAALMHSPARRKALIGELGRALDRTGDGGIMFDFEDLPDGSLGDLVQLVRETRRVFAPHHRVVAVTMPAGDVRWPARALGAAADEVILMAYDEHWAGGQPGPIASDAWFNATLAAEVPAIGRDKAVIALGSYAYDWHDGHTDALTVEEAWLEAHDSQEAPVFDRASGNAGFSFLDEGHRHDLWLLDAPATWNELLAVRRAGVGSIALWRLGSEDPGFWTALQTWRAGSGTPRLEGLAERENVDVEGDGEILRIAALPHPGRRAVQFDPRTNQAIAETYQVLPTPYVVQRTGAASKEVALTFDDGPDPEWTPQILSILERYHVPATFFVIGENGLENHALLQRMVADGDEIGNHTYTHPNMAQEFATGIKLELNATQRLIEAFTGRSTRLFRAPYFGDAEPTTTDELVPALIAQRQGYTVVGLHVDPDDWKRPGASTIVERVMREVSSNAGGESHNIVLLHDGGGNRAQTVAALPQLIARLQADGYRIVTTAKLAGLSRDAVMPRVSGPDRLSAQADLTAFTAIAALVVTLKWLFFLAIALGVFRAVGLAVLAVTAPRREPPPPLDPTPLVTVIIPAFNEARVIADSIRRILDSDYPALDVIVADDGSRDATSAVVRDQFGASPQVRLLTLSNGGKAAALNRALSYARGEIVVALDADTQFERATIGQLVRWFANPRIGAVAGNAKVGNRVNLVTRWQAIEYIVAQNLERRALARFDAITVVPGAVGAWRRAALDAVGGYPEDTLAEDQDLTIAVQRAGWKVAYDPQAVAWTEAPETMRSLARQRFRWSYGTLQCLWKHRAVLARGRPGGLAFVGMPQAWLFQILFAVISPAIDLALVGSVIATVLRAFQHGWAQAQTDVIRMGAYWLGFCTVDLLCGLIAFRLDTREQRFTPVRLLLQRFVYRQMMYGVVIRAVSAAGGGLAIGWGKLERSGRVTAPATPAS
jgi:cellulose synthase/poly-beta-1,6-N-acetylglucosamine synthase-like glycosyltransferase/peptidoglycan/xylan/chitin deacetylase (PgdA/CDA1 family)/spore germination protein YaaH